MSRDPHRPTETFEALLQRHRAAFERLALRLAQDPEEAQDLLQETLLDAYRGFHGFRPQSSFYTWVARIMTNNWMDRARRRRRLATVSLEQGPEPSAAPLELPDESADPARVVLEELLDAPLASALQALQPQQRETVLLCDVEGASYEEAARAQACPIGTIRSRLHRAHRALRALLRSLDPSVAESTGAAARLQSRRAFLQFGTAAAAGAALTQLGAAEARPRTRLRVLVWTDSPTPRGADPQGVHAALLDAFRRGEEERPEAARSFEVRAACGDDPAHGLGDAALEATDVLVWWQGEPGEPARRESLARRAEAVARRVRDGMGLVLLHGGLAGPVAAALLGPETGWAQPPAADGSDLLLRVTAPRHPIATGIESLRLPRAGRPGIPALGAQPEILLFDSPGPGEPARIPQGMVWRIGRGRVFYFQPGPASAPLYAREEVSRLLRRAARWCAGRPAEE